MKLDKTLFGTLCIAGVALTSGCVVDGGYVHAVAPAQTVVVPTATVVAPAVVTPTVVVPARPWYHGPRFWGHRHHHHHGRHR